MFVVEHPILPTHSPSMTERPWRFVCFELISIVSILDEKVKMSVDMHVNDDGSIVYDIMMKIL